ncbi:hypothetical protein GCM10008107_06810 [Psychrosphaera saromensis]|uniref:Uncharacterized protein n=1 Tax=Psychrosphaera saromensis TaxID=716813 RepID=A0A2S7UYS1_9GAMM|nr:carbohydrate binding family 9 domain-containing protein [Psychrosphaera saromensis]PQJ54410.1 hypothetical protein BTO11_12575 [Psychrosphaera saromensis]GHB60223.1 hypothetical protein GCM10008107_06810 [Psychrosphaera saromensis]GLQ14621.1 hypothetical protein GCM10007917_20760 [Psychrosphaera saromensis]
MKFCIKSVFLFTALVAVKPVYSETITSNTLVTTILDVPKTQQRIKVDGHMDEDIWKNALKIDLNNVTWPYENTRSPVKTEAYVIENGHTLYVAFKAFDPHPEKIRARLTDRDNNWGDDRVAIKIDTYNDNALAYQFFINPLGTQSDVLENELTKSESSSWDVIWNSAGRITDFGYVVEVAIPLRTLNFNDQLDIQNWGMEFVRFYPRDTELRISHMQVDHNNTCFICQMPTLRGFKGAKQGKNLSLVPTFVSGNTKSRELDETLEWSEESNTDVGLDVKWGITPDTTLNATFNPDFSQVEADSGQLDVNSTFGLYTAEKRAFFLANEDAFSTPVNLIYTRNINNPDFGAKLAGKVDQHSFAGFVANDQTTSFILPGNLGSDLYELEEKSTNAAFRYRYALNNDASIGALSTIRNSESYQNVVTSLDGKYKLTDSDVLNIQFVSSSTEIDDVLINSINTDDYNSEQVLRADSNNSTDSFYRIDYQHDNKDWSFKASREDIGKDFRADLAFFNKSDTITNLIGGTYRWLGNSKDWWNRIEVFGDWDRTTNQDGDQIEQEYEIYLTLRGVKQSYFKQGLVVREKASGRIDTSTLSIKNNTYNFTEKILKSWANFQATSDMWLGIYGSVGKQIDYANNQLVDAYSIDPQFNWNINTHIKSDLSYKYRKLHKGGNEILTAKLTDYRLNYQFSIRSFLRLSIVYSDVTRNLSQYNDPDDYDATYKSLSTQLLYSYKINPKTLFFVGYSDGGYQDDSLKDITKDTRSVFLKMSYAWLR